MRLHAELTTRQAYSIQQLQLRLNKLNWQTKLMEIPFPSTILCPCVDTNVNMNLMHILMGYTLL